MLCFVPNALLAMIPLRSCLRMIFLHLRELASQLAPYEASGKTQLSVMEVNGPDISKYGVVVPNGDQGCVAGLVEKPEAEKAPSNLASIGRYVLTPDIFDILRTQSAGAGGEIQLADAINTQASNNAVQAVTLNGLRFDCGSVRGYLDAIMHVAGRRNPDFLCVPPLRFL